jgi:crotonobetainyl-CoA:carnitine CoA-transferase CaiB-like acyl-CoA transferase
MTSQPLAGVRVLELGRLLAAPLAAQILGDLGAEVVKVERAGRGDDFRRYGPVFLKDADGQPTPESAGYISTNRNKRSVTVDFAKPEGREVILGLARRCDVFIENFKVGNLADYGLDYASVRRINPGVIYLSVTGFGQTGPYAARPGTDGAFQALSGLMSITGEPDGEPTRVGTFAVDYVTGVYGAVAVLAALRHRELNGGGGQAIDLALFDSAIAAMAPRSTEYLIGGPSPKRAGNRLAGAAPSQPYRCSDGYLQVQAAMEEHFRVLCDLIDRPALAEDPRFATLSARIANVEALAVELESVFETRSIGHWYDLLSEGGLIVAPIYDVAQCFDDPHVRSRGLRVTTPHELGVTVDLVASPMRFSATPIETYRAPPTQGEGVADVLAEWLGYTSEQVSDLRAIGAV